MSLFFCCVKNRQRYYTLQKNTKLSHDSQLHLSVNYLDLWQIRHNVFILVQQQRDQLFEAPKTAVQHLSTCLELFSGICKYRIWLMTLPEMGAGWEFDTFVHLPNF